MAACTEYAANSATPPDPISHSPFSSKLGRVNGCSRRALKISGISALMFCASFGCKVRRAVGWRADVGERKTVKLRWDEICLQGSSRSPGILWRSRRPRQTVACACQNLKGHHHTTSSDSYLTSPPPPRGRRANQQPSFKRPPTEGASIGH